MEDNTITGLYPTTSEADPNFNEYGIDRDSKHYADKTQAAIVRANWDRSRKELNPLVNRLQSIYNRGPENSLNAASGSAMAGFDRGLRTTSRDMQRHGVKLTPDQQKSYDRQAQLQRGISDVSARNTAARGYDDLRQTIASGA